MKILRPAFLGAALSVPLALTLLSSASAQSYNFTDFDASGSGQPTTVNGISNSGSVVGTLLNADGTNTSFSGTPSPGTFTTLNLPGSASANGVNTGGQVVGSDGSNAFVLDSASAGAAEQPLSPVNDTTLSEVAFGINDGGAIVGQYVDTGSAASSLGFLDTQGNYTTLNPTGDAVTTSAQGINNAGLVTGFYGPAANPDMTSGFLFDTLTSQYTLITDPSVSDLAFTQFLGINDSGEAVGYYGTNAGAQHGFLYNTTTDQYTFLDDPNVAPNGSAVMQITGITDSGEIAGFYSNADNTQQFGFIATPAAVPEASSSVSLSLLLLFGLGGVYAAKKRKATA